MHAAASWGTFCQCHLSRLVPENKVAEIRRLGADVRIVAGSQGEAQEEVQRLVRENELVLLPPFDHPDIIAGQGTSPSSGLRIPLMTRRCKSMSILRPESTRAVGPRKPATLRASNGIGRRTQERD